MAVALIQGASRGLGLQFTKVLAARTDVAQVIATSRRAEQSDALFEAQKLHPGKISLVNLDVTSEDEIRSASPNISALAGGKLDLMVNCSAILHPSGRGETSMRDISSEGLKNTFMVNAAGPLLMAKYFSTVLTKGKGLIGSQNDKKHTAIIINITAKVSSISGKTTFESCNCQPVRSTLLEVPPPRIFTKI